MTNDSIKSKIKKLILNARVANEEKNYKSTEKILKEALELDPKHVTVLNNLGVCYIHLKKYKKAQSYIEKALEIELQDEVILSNMSYCFFEQSNYEKALYYLNKINSDSDNIDQRHGYIKLTRQAIKYSKEYKKFKNTKTISSLCEYIEIIDKIKENEDATFIYRGQNNHFYPLKSSLYRENDFNEREENMIKDFNLKADAYFNHEMAHFDKVDKLALMQHHGVPTRLLDFTESPLVALYFALENNESTNYYDKAPCVYMLNVKAFDKNIKGHILSSSQVKDNSNDDSIIFNSKYKKHTFVFSPKLKNKRLTSQKGVFVFIHEDKALEESIKENITKIIISRQNMRKIKQELLNSGITPTTIYPDFAGLAEEVKKPRQFVKEELAPL